MKRLLPAIFSLILILGCIAYLYLNHSEPEPEPDRTVAYIASANYSIPYYVKNDSLLHKCGDLIRGTRVVNRNITVEVNDGAFLFTEIELEGMTDPDGNPVVYYVSGSNLTEHLEDVVRDTSRYVRTSVTVYENPQDSRIASFLKKGTELSICGYYGLQEDGSVEMYKIDNPGAEGYVYTKYLADTQEEANEVYTQTADIHSGRAYDFELYGGSPDTLDWYPVEKEELSTGPLLTDARAIYLNADALSPDSIDYYITLAADAGANAIVADIKDGILGYASKVAQEYSPTAYANAAHSVDDYFSSIQKIKNAGLYVIGRIVTFNDDYYAYDHPEECIESDVEGSLWPSAYSRNCWSYNVALALEAADFFGFNEIQFDYVRFPESAYMMSESGTTDFKNTYNEEKAEAVQNFCLYAKDMLHRNGVYVSVDVFGECVGEYVTAYGQYWPAISNVVDVISGMPYTDHFGADNDTWSYPYTTVYEWAMQAAVRQKEIRTPAVARTWITGYDTPNWNPMISYGQTALIEQAQALYDAGLTGGFIPWNGISDLNKYYAYLAVWNYDYK